MKQVTFLGVEFDPQTVSQYQENLTRALETPRQTFIVTPNPEMLVAGNVDSTLKQILQRADLRIVDGFGLVMMSGGRLSRFPGVEVLAFLVENARRQGLRVLLAGGMFDGDAEKAAQRLGIDGCSPGRIEYRNGRWEGDGTLKQKIASVRPDVLALALGHGKQERWLADHLPTWPFIRVGIGVGGALEFYAGRQARAPKLLRMLGLEWLYRFLREPYRARRILTAVLVFPALVLWEKLRHTR